MPLFETCPKSRTHFLPGLIIVLLILSSFSAWATEDSFKNPDCAIGPIQKLLFQTKGPRGQFFEGRTFATEDGKSWVYGINPALQGADIDILKAKPIIEALVGSPSQDIEIATAVVGSLARKGKMGSFSDVDLEAVWVVPVAPGNAKNMYNPTGKELKSVVELFKNNLFDTIKKHPQIKFIELKAGQYFDPLENQYKGLKWSLQDIELGYKIKPDSKNKTQVKLEQAFAENARIKADWAIPSIQNGASPYAYQEASIVYQIATKTGNNQPRLRSIQGKSLEFPPMRGTVLTLSEHDALLLQDSSQNSLTHSLDEVYQSSLHDLIKYQQDRAKQLKRMYALLQFWENPELLSPLLGKTIDKKALELDILSILHLPEVQKISLIKSQADVFSTLQSKNIKVPGDFDLLWKKQIGLEDKTYEEIKEAQTQDLTQIIDKALLRKKDLRLYLEHLKSRSAFANGTLRNYPIFLAGAPSQDWTSLYRNKINKWAKKYPHLKFTRPEDLHMTFYYAGKLTDTGETWLNQKLAATPNSWSFTHGGAHILGKNNQFLVIQFKASDETLNQVYHLRAQAITAGARPDLDHTIFIPHVSIASIDPQLESSRIELDQFLRNEDTSPFENINVGKISSYRRKSDSLEPSESQFELSP